MPIGDLPKAPKELLDAKDTFDLGPFRENFEEAKELKLNYEHSKARWELFKNRLKARAGKASQLVLDGVVVATHAISGPFNTSKFAKEQPHIYEQYLVEVTHLVFDEEKFAADHPVLYAGDEYRARSLRFKN